MNYMVSLKQILTISSFSFASIIILIFMVKLWCDLEKQLLKPES